MGSRQERQLRHSSRIRDPAGHFWPSDLTHLSSRPYGPGSHPQLEVRPMATEHNETPYTADAPCCGASASPGAFSVFQEEPADAACRCCGTVLVEGSLI